MVLGVDRGHPGVISSDTHLLGKHTQDTYDPVFRERILDTEGVTGIVSYASSFDGETRKISVRAVIGTVYGETTIQEVF